MVDVSIQVQPSPHHLLLHLLHPPSPPPSPPPIIITITPHELGGNRQLHDHQLHSLATILHFTTLLSSSTRSPPPPNPNSSSSLRICEREKAERCLAESIFSIYEIEVGMVSVRKAWRKLMGLSPGHNTSVGPQLGFPNSGGMLAKHPRGTNPVSVYPMPPSDAEQQTHSNVTKFGIGASNISASSSTVEQHEQPISGIKRRKPHKRKVSHDRQPCLMRGVYFKNMKWQAAIKVEKKQIHLGTVSTQEEAAHLYDRAAFMCGREPNFEISEEEKQELMKLNWDEFLTLTRHTINNKKHRRRRQVGMKKLPAASQMGNPINEDEQEISNTSASEE